MLQTHSNQQSQKYIRQSEKNWLDEENKIQNGSIQQLRPFYNYWSIEEQTIYLRFLVENAAQLSRNGGRRKLRMFKRVSMLLGTRSPKQVKSHHQKLQQKFKSIQKIINKLCKSIKLEKELLDTSASSQEIRFPFSQARSGQAVQQNSFVDTPFFRQFQLQGFIKFTYEDGQYSPNFE